MSALLWKELHQLRAIGWLWLVILVFDFVAYGISGRLDEQSVLSLCAGACEPGVDLVGGAALALLVMITAYSLYPREVSDRTLEYLHALPVRRYQIFVAKLIAALALMLGVLLVSSILFMLVLALNPQSIDGRQYPRVMAWLYLRDAFFIFIVLAHGIFLSRFQSVGLLIYAVVMAMILYAETVGGSLGMFNLLRVREITYDGQLPQLNWSAIGFHGLVALLLLVWAAGLWRRVPAPEAGQASPRWWAARSMLTQAVGVLVALGALAWWSMSAGLPDAGDDLLSATTGHYRFVYRDVDDEALSELIGTADDDLRQLAAWLDTQDLPVIQADLTAASEHLAGVASWKKIRMDLSAGQSPAYRRHVLAHETVHVLQGTVSERAFWDVQYATRFFSEGMAQYLAYRLWDVSPTENERRRQDVRLAAALWQRYDLQFDELADDALLAKKYNPDLVYTLGDVWTEALVQTCGLEALGDTLRGVAAGDFPAGLPGEALWRELLNRLDCDLEAVNRAWAALLEAAMPASEIERFPEYAQPVVKLDPSGRTVIVTATVRVSPGVDGPRMPWLRYASGERIVQGYDRQVTGRWDKEDVYAWTAQFRLPVAEIVNGRFRYQLGFDYASDGFAYFEPWQTGHVP